MALRAGIGNLEEESLIQQGFHTLAVAINTLRLFWLGYSIVRAIFPVMEPFSKV